MTGRILAACLGLLLSANLALAGSVFPDTRGPSGSGVPGSIAASGATASEFIGGYPTVTVQLTGTWVGTIQFEVSNLASSGFVTVNCTPSNSTATVTSATANGLWACAANGAQYFRLNATAWTSGTATVTTSFLGARLGGRGGTVTSVDASVPSILTISGNPITTSGTLAFGLATETANTVLAGPTAAPAAAPTFRSLTLASADFANQGTTSTVLHGNAAGNPSFVAVTLGTDTSGNYVANAATTAPLGGGSTGSAGASLTLTCTTCVTSVTGTAPVASSGGTTPAISITGVAGQVLAGSGPAFTATPTLGVNATTTGQLLLANGGVGGAAATVQNNGATTAYNFNLPTTAGTSGQFLTSGGGGTSANTWTTNNFVTSVTGTAPIASSGGTTPAISITGVAGQVLAGSGPAFTATPTLGVNATTTGQVLLANGGASGASVTVQNNGATAAYNFNLPTGAGTSGQFLTSGAGGTTAMTWTTNNFVTSVTGTAPVASSGGTTPAISITGVAGQVLAGSGPAFTATPTLGVNATTTGQLLLANGGASGASVTIQNNGATAAYNFNLPTGAGTSGQPLLSGGGAGAAMTFGTLAFGNGGTGLTTAADDTILNSNGSAWSAIAVPDCTDTGGRHLNYAAATNALSCGTTSGSASVAWTGITAGSGSTTTANGDSAIIYNVAQTTAGRLSWRFSETTASTSTGTPVLVQIDTIAASNALPLLVSSRGTEVFRISATAAQILHNAGSSTVPSVTDVTSVNTGLFWPATNTLGIGNGTDGEWVRWLSFAQQVNQAGANTTAYTINARKARGTVASPTVITTGDNLLTIDGYGYVGATNTYQQATRMLHNSAGTISDSATGIGGVLDFLTAIVGAEPALRMRIDNVGHLVTSGTAPTVSACGTSPSVVGTDMAILVTIGTGGTATSCTVSFAQTWLTNAPVCIFAPNDTNNPVVQIVVTTTSAVLSTGGGALVASSKFDVLCLGRI